MGYGDKDGLKGERVDVDKSGITNREHQTPPSHREHAEPQCTSQRCPLFGDEPEIIADGEVEIYSTNYQ